MDLLTYLLTYNEWNCGIVSLCYGLCAVGWADVFDDKASMLCRFWQAGNWQNYSGFSACCPLEVPAH